MTPIQLAIIGKGPIPDWYTFEPLPGDPAAQPKPEPPKRPTRPMRPRAGGADGIIWRRKPHE